MPKPKRKPIVLVSVCEELLDKSSRKLYVLKYFTVGWSTLSNRYKFNFSELHPIAYRDPDPAQRAAYRIALKQGLMLLDNVSPGETFDVERSLSYWEKIVDNLIAHPCEYHQQLANEILQQAIGVCNALEYLNADRHQVQAV